MSILLYTCGESRGREEKRGQTDTRTNLPVITRQGVLQPHGQAAGVHEINGGIPLILNYESQALDGSGQEEGTRVVATLEKEGGSEGVKER